MKLYTKTGDMGFTSIANEKNISKSDIRIKLLGSIDELTSYIGLAKSELKDINLNKDLESIQTKLIKLMSHIADNENEDYFFSDYEVEWIEKTIDKYEALIIRPNKFILPGKCRLSAIFDIARAVARRAETNLIDVVKIYKIDENIKKYINRLSDFLYISARYVDFIYTMGSEVAKAMEVYKNPKFDSNNIDLELAKWLIEKVEIKSKDLNLSSAIAVVNKAGNPIAIHCMDDSFLASFDIAYNKAYTAVALKMSTLKLKSMSQPNQSLYGIQNTNSGRIVIFGGGVPLISGNKIVGGLGVSGGTEEQDTLLAEYGEKVFKENI